MQRRIFSRNLPSRERFDDGAGPPAAGEPGQPAETTDALWDGSVRLLQSRSGYRFSLDSILLACFADVAPAVALADLGTGNGVVAILLAVRYPTITVTGVELQQPMLERARRNVRLNDLTDRVSLVHGDVQTIKRIAKAESFEAVVCNPPYRKARTGRLNPNEEKQIARHESTAKLADFIAAGRFLLKAGGTMAFVYPAVRTIDLLHTMRSADIEPKRVRLVHSFAGAKASLVLAEGVKRGRPGVIILPPLIIYEADRNYSAEVQRMLRGD
jgi:tRNA1Val (adenine37-N6)-methyltransferase